jgi:hypothetical protein
MIEKLLNTITLQNKNKLLKIKNEGLKTSYKSLKNQLGRYILSC